MQSEAQPNIGGKRVNGLASGRGDQPPRVSVITAVYNGSKTIEATIQSVLSQTYDGLEYLVIDGGSTDGTVDIIRKYEREIDLWVSEPDKGVYDAMNKGIGLSRGSWLSFLNANDIFCEPSTIESIANSYFEGNARFIYSDVLVRNGPSDTPRLLECDHKRLILNHQASIYQKELHGEYGPYLVAPKVTISDYLFFSLIQPADYRKANRPISIYDTTGMSQSRAATEQKFIVDYLINGMSRYRFLGCFCFYHFYRSAKAAIAHFRYS